MTRMRFATLTLAIATALLVPLAGASSNADAASPLVTLPITGSTSGHGTFTGALALSRVGADNGRIFVEGVVTGTVARTKSSVGTFVSVPVQLPLTGNWGPIAAVAPGSPLAEWRGETVQRRILLAQSCGILHLDIGAVTLNVLGVVVTTDPITLDLSGDSAAPLGSIVCALLGLVGTVGNLLNLLTSLLGGLGGALGGTAPAAI